MPRLAQYEDKYPNIRLERRDGILQVTLHTRGDSLKWGALNTSVHQQAGDALYQIGRDTENKVVILTGTGDVFCTSLDMDEMPTAPDADYWPGVVREGKDLLMNLLEIEVPVIGVVNGPATIHAELVLLSDIVLASDTAVFADHAHFTAGVVPGDGVHVVWPMLLGPNRSRYFLLTGEQIDALEARTLGLVGEVHPRDAVLARAWELAAQIAAKPDRTRRYARVALTQHIKKRMLDELGYGLTMEAFGLT
jgi:enoyl-CoA hydratase/carnithine racemase